MDGLDGLDAEHEDEADRFAADQLIPPAAAHKLQGLRSEQEVKAAAEALGIDSAWGWLQKRYADDGL